MSPKTKNQERKAFLNAFFYPAVFVILLWMIKLSEIIFHFSLANAGILPRDLYHLPAILTMPLLHANIAHVLSNSAPLLVLGGFIFYFYPKVAWNIIIWIYILSGLWLWLGGREAYHIGASGLVYGWATFLFVSGIFKRNTPLIAVSLVIAFSYGSLIWGFFPQFFPKENISWEGHLFGSIAGLLMAVYYRSEGPQPRIYHWEDEEDEEENEEAEDAYWETDLPPDKTSLDENAHAAHFRRR